MGKNLEYVKELEERRPMTLSYLEKGELAISGLLDRRRGFPVETAQGEWHSPTVDQELFALRERCSAHWANLQLKLEPQWAGLKAMLLRKTGLVAEVTAAKAALEEATASTASPTSARKKGEEALSDAQALARRTAEYRRSLEPFKTRVTEAGAALLAAEEEISRTLSLITERINTVHCICQRLKNHTLLRIHFYWRVVLSNRGRVRTLPPVVDVEVSDTARAEYIALHKALIEEAEGNCDSSVDHHCREKKEVE